MVVAPYLRESAGATSGIADVPRAVGWDDFVAPFGSAPIAYERMPFEAPLYILYSSGTTGVPKCIVHGAGGTLLELVNLFAELAEAENKGLIEREPNEVELAVSVQIRDDGRA